MSRVIVFGPTGNVGSVTALTAQKCGAKVFLAMRNPQKSIPGLSADEEKDAGFERVQADLTKPDTVAAAVEKTGATRAFVYLAFGGPQDHMKSTLTALKSAGVEFVVFLSSFTIRGKLDDIQPSDFIPFIHARVELSLNEVFGEDNYVALRPGAFATNMLRHKDGVAAGDVRIFGSAYKFDCITYEDMGRVGGTILAQGPKEGQRKVYLYGPQSLSQKKILGVIGEVLGKEVKVTDIDEKEALEQFEREGVPKPASDYMIRKFKESTDDTTADIPYFEEGVKNVELYTGRPSTGLREWVEAHKDLFSA